MSGQERAVVGVIGAVLLLLFILLFWPRSDPQAPHPETNTPRTKATSETPPVVRDEPPPPVEPPAREQPTRIASAAMPEPTPPPDSSSEPPPLSGLILTFPSDMTEGEMDDEMAKCHAVVSRRRGTYVKVLPDRGSSYDKIKECFRFSHVSVQEERMAPLTP